MMIWVNPAETSMSDHCQAVSMSSAESTIKSLKSKIFKGMSIEALDKVLDEYCVKHSFVAKEDVSKWGASSGMGDKDMVYAYVANRMDKGVVVAGYQLRIEMDKEQKVAEIEVEKIFTGP